MPDFGDQYYVTFTSEAGGFVRVLVDAASPALMGGYGGWEVVERPKRKSITRWRGVGPWQQDLAILFDGFMDEIDQSTSIQDLIDMSQPRGNLTQPPKVTIDGLAEGTNLTWVIQDIKFSSDRVIRDIGVIYRQPAIVSLIEFVDDQVIKTKTSPAIVSRTAVTPSKQVSAPTNATLQSLAIKYYHDPSKWQDIWRANPFLIDEPRAPIPHGISLTIPGQLAITTP